MNEISPEHYEEVLKTQYNAEDAFTMAYRLFYGKGNMITANDVATALYSAAQEMLDIVHLIATEEHSENLFAERIGGSVNNGG